MLTNVLSVHVVTAPRVSTILLSIDATVETILLDLTVNDVSVHGLFEHYAGGFKGVGRRPRPRIQKSTSLSMAPKRGAKWLDCACPHH